MMSSARYILICYIQLVRKSIRLKRGNVIYRRTSSCERESNHVDSIVKTEFKNILFVFLSNSWDIDLSSWQIHVFLVTNAAGVLHSNDDAFLFFCGKHQLVSLSF